MSLITMQNCYSSNLDLQEYMVDAIDRPDESMNVVQSLIVYEESAEKYFRLEVCVKNDN